MIAAWQGFAVMALKSHMILKGVNILILEKMHHDGCDFVFLKIKLRYFK